MAVQGFDLWKFILDNTLSFLFTTFVLGVVVEVVRRLISFLMTLSYRGWRIVVIPNSKSNRGQYEQDILLEEVKRFENSSFERRKFIQSVVTSEGGWLYAGQVDVSDPNGWVHIDRQSKRYVFDMNKLPPKPAKSE